MCFPFEIPNQAAATSKEALDDRLLWNSNSAYRFMRRALLLAWREDSADVTPTKDAVRKQIFMRCFFLHKWIIDELWT